MTVLHTTTIQINEITEKTKKSIRVRTITALVIAAVAIPAIIFGDWVFLIFGLLISVQLLEQLLVYLIIV